MTLAIAINLYFCLSGIILGSIGMYLFDPERGERRRTMLRSRFIARLGHFNTRLDASFCDMQQRMRGLASKVRRRHTP